MNSERWKRVEALYHAARARPAGERDEFLLDACRDDDALRRDVESLLNEPVSDDGFLDRSPLELTHLANGGTDAALVGRSLGGYHLQRLLGAGGMGEVYLAQDARLGRDVAIKILPRAFTSDPARLARFEREARLLAALNHPNICAIHGFEEADGVRFLILELVDGQTLAERLAAGRPAGLPVGEAVAIARQIAEALETAHEKGIVHRDLKPANIKITTAGVVKVLDFGLAKGTENGAATPLDGTQDGMILGTVGYMSPEQARGKVVDKRGDIWAFGCVLYEMLTGKVAFAGDTMSDVIGRILEREPEWSALPANIPVSLDRLMHRCLTKDPKQRLRDIGEVRIQFDATNEADPAVTASSTATDTHGRWLPWAAAGLSLAVALLLAIPTVRHLREVTSAVRRYEITTPPTSDLLSLAISPDDSRIVFVATVNGRTRLWIRPLDATEAEALPGTEDAQLPFWSPDGKSIGFFADGELKRLDLAGGKTHHVANVLTGRGGTWNRDDVILFAPGSGNAPLLRVPADGGSEPVAALRPTEGQKSLRFPQFLPDGRHFLYYVVGSPETQGMNVAVLGAAEGRRLLDVDGAVYAPPGYLFFVRQGRLAALAFDPDRLTIPPGDPIPVADRVVSNLPYYIGGAAVSVSASGLIAYRTAPDISVRQLEWRDRSDRLLRIVGEPDSHSPFNLELSPDEKTVALDRTVNNNRDIWLRLITNGFATPLTKEGKSALGPIFSPDGLRVAYRSNPVDAFDLFERPTSGTGQPESLLESADAKIAQAWSPNFFLYLAVSAKIRPKLWALPLAKTEASAATPFPVIEGGGEERDGQLSPNEHWIAYATKAAGDFNVVVQAFPRPGPRGPIPISTRGGVQPRWSHDGHELFFITLDGQLMAVSLLSSADGQSLEPGDPTPLFAARFAGGPVPALNSFNKHQYAVSKDGRFLLNVDIGENVTPPIQLVQNWTAVRK